MPGSSWDRWRSRTSTSSRGCRRPSPSTRSPPHATRVPRWAPSRRSTTTSESCTRASGTRTARTAGGPSAARRRTRSWTRSWSCPRARGSRCSLPWCAAARVSTRSSCRIWRTRGSRAPASTARCASCRSPSVWPRPTSTPSRSSWTAWWPSRTSAAAWPTPSRPPSSWRRASPRSRCRRMTARTSRRSRRRSRARIAGSAMRSWHPATSPSTLPTGPAPRATDWARGSRSTPSSSSRRPSCPSMKAPWRRGPAPRSNTGTVCWMPSASRTTSTWTRRGSG